MKNLIIGNTSQLAYYFDNTYEKISARNIDFENFKLRNFDRVYICFAEQRTFNRSLTLNDFMKVNYDYTLKFINFFKERSRQIIFYSTIELWNKKNGPININTPFKHTMSNYVISKRHITDYLLTHKAQYSNIIIHYLSNFNSIYRKNGFLFAKVFDSIINLKKIELGNTYFYRDLIHPKFIVNQSISLQQNAIIGSARLTFVNDFIRSLYKAFDLNYEDFVKEMPNNLNEQNNIFYLEHKECMYNLLLTDTIEELKLLKEEKEAKWIKSH
jgi:nucleoside-diphosphate-sugar epimerase